MSLRNYLLLSFLFLFSYVAAQVDITNLQGGLITTQYSDSPFDEEVSKLIDNSFATKFLTFNPSTWIVFKSVGPYVLSKYTLTSGNDAPERDPKNWELQGSNNGVTYSTIDTRSNQTFVSRGLKREFVLSNNTKAYVYYRLLLTNNSGTILQLSELELWGMLGTMPTDIFADYSVDLPIFSGSPVTFTNASLNASSYSWTFEGGTPSTSFDANPQVTFASSGTFAVTLVASDGTNTSTRKSNFLVKDINDWSTFIYPTVTLSCSSTSNAGYLKYKALVLKKGFASIEDFVRNCCLTIAKELYYSVDEANAHNLRAINYVLTEGGVLSYKGGAPPTIEIGFDMNYLNSFSQSHSDVVSADEIYGVLCHEICHGYQREPKNAGAYGTPSEFYGFIEGSADLARLLTGGFNPPRNAQQGGTWLDAYNTTAFFYNWLTKTKSATFLKDLNKTALTIDPWTLNAATQKLFGQSAQLLWSEYQAAIPTLAVNSIKDNGVSFQLNSDKTVVSFEKLENNTLIKIFDLSGKLLCSKSTHNSTENIDISTLRKGIYILNISNNKVVGASKFIK